MIAPLRMPSSLHGALRDVFRDDPMLAADLLREMRCYDGAPIERASLVDPTVPQNVAPSLAIDAAVAFHSDGHPVLLALIEVQLAIDADKPWDWPVYGCALRREHRCPFVVLVVSPDARVARWATEPIALGPGSEVRVAVLGPDRVPWVRTASEAKKRPTLAFLSAVAHGNDEHNGIDTVFAALSAAGSLDEARAKTYTAALWDALDASVQRTLERAMESNDPAIESNFERRMREIFEARGESRGEARGEARAVAAMQAAVLRAFRERNIAITDAQHAAVAQCNDGETLLRWLFRAATARSYEEVVE